MEFPLTYEDLSLWLAITTIILLITSEVVSTSKGKRKLIVARKRLRNVAFITSILFLVTVLIRIYEIIFS